MITVETVNELVAKLDMYADEVRGDDDIMNALISHLIRNIEADLTQLWFYGSALKQRKTSKINYFPPRELGEK